MMLILFPILVLVFVFRPILMSMFVLLMLPVLIFVFVLFMFFLFVLGLTFRFARNGRYTFFSLLIGLIVKCVIGKCNNSIKQVGWQK